MEWSVDYLDPSQVVILPQIPYILDDPNAQSITSELAIPSQIGDDNGYVMTDH